MSLLRAHWRPVTSALLATLLLLLGYAWGRHSAPGKVVTQTATHEVVKIVEVEKKATQTQTHIAKNAHRTTKSVTTRTPNGTVTTTKESTVDVRTGGDVTQNTQEEKTTHAEQKTDKSTRTEVSNSSVWRISGLVGLSRSPGDLTLKVVYGGHVQRTLFGPVNAGVWFLTTGAAGASLGVEW
jgi:hypothetical protein